MRLSLGQELRLVQKQVLAPRMIQSMEILQLPIIALQERIEQEMEDNPVLDQVEPTDDEETIAAETESPDAPSDGERELVVDDSSNQEDDFERLLNMAENLPDEYEELSRPSRGEIEAEGDRRHDQMAKHPDHGSPHRNREHPPEIHGSEEILVADRGGLDRPERRWHRHDLGTALETGQDLPDEGEDHHQRTGTQRHVQDPLAPAPGRALSRPWDRRARTGGRDRTASRHGTRSASPSA